MTQTGECLGFKPAFYHPPYSHINKMLSLCCCQGPYNAYNNLLVDLNHYGFGKRITSCVRCCLYQKRIDRHIFGVGICDVYLAVLELLSLFPNSRTYGPWLGPFTSSSTGCRLEGALIAHLAYLWTPLSIVIFPFGQPAVASWAR